MATPIPGRIELPINADSLRYKFPDNPNWVMALNGNKMMLAVLDDMPGSTNKAYSITTEEGTTVQHERVITKEGGITATYTDPPEPGGGDVSPNLTRNKFSGAYDTYKIYRAP